MLTLRSKNLQPYNKLWKAAIKLAVGSKRKPAVKLPSTWKMTCRLLKLLRFKRIWLLEFQGRGTARAFYFTMERYLTNLEKSLVGKLEPVNN